MKCIATSEAFSETAYNRAAMGGEATIKPTIIPVVLRFYKEKECHQPK